MSGYIVSYQARIQGVGAGASAHLWDGEAPFKIHHSIAFKHQFITGRPPLREILYPSLSARGLNGEVGGEGEKGNYRE